MNIFLVILLFLMQFAFGKVSNSHDCLGGYQDNLLKDKHLLQSQLSQDLNSAVTFESSLKVIDKYSACPAQEPGTDIYFSFSRAMISLEGNELIVKFKDVGQISTKDGTIYEQGQLKDEVIVRFTIIKTDKGLRIGHKKHRTLLTNGFYLTKETVKNRFSLKR